VLHHAQKILAVFTAMRDFASQLRRDGHRVGYVALDAVSNRQCTRWKWYSAPKPPSAASRPPWPRWKA
jgi:deoxyribodipyrimidine photolyase-like uncharacterized protein